MNLEEAVKTLQRIKTYCAAESLETVDYVIAVLEKLKKDGVKDPLNTDFSKLN